VPEVFALSRRGPAVIDHDGVRVELVHPERAHGGLKWLGRATRMPVLRTFRGAAEHLSGAAQLADALEARDRVAPFDLVQSSEYCATGWYVRPRAGRVHVVRCSAARELLKAVDKGDSPNVQRSRIYYELESVRRAELVYAPSRFVAEHYRRRLNRAVAVIRPPLHTAAVNGDGAARGALPRQYLLHFGQLRGYKGTMWLLDSLPLAWRKAPELQMLFVGPIRDSGLRKRMQRMIPGEKRVTHIDTVDRAKMYSILKGAAAAVLPSLADNLPNTAIESLCMGIPVIGTLGASIDELVQHGRHGELVPMNDVPALAEAMVRAWRGESVAAGFRWDAPIVGEMEPMQSVIALGKLVRMDFGRINGTAQV
jgi:glycosyltransferase involved in cell wall biosynthesis